MTGDEDPKCELCGGTGEIPADDVFDEANWPKANPNYPVTPKRDFMMEQASDARTNARSLHAFKRYHCNIRVSSLNKAIEDAYWAKCRDEFDDWSKADAICGAWDMGGQDDLGAIGLCARFDTGQKELDFSSGKPTKRPVYRFEVDAVGFLNTDSERDVSKEPWAEWIRKELLWVNSQEINEMRQVILHEFRENGVRSWAHDPANSRDFGQSLVPEGLEVVPFYQTGKMWTEPMTNFMRDVKKRRVIHDGNGLLAWAVSNMIAVNMSRSGSTQIMPDKANSPDKIDPIVAVMMAYRLATIAPPRSRGKSFMY